MLCNVLHVLSLDLSCGIIVSWRNMEIPVECCLHYNYRSTLDWNAHHFIIISRNSGELGKDIHAPGMVLMKFQGHKDQYHNITL